MGGVPGEPGETVRIAWGDWAAEVSTRGAALGQLMHTGGALLDGFSPAQGSSAARGQILAPWTNRVRDGRYEFGGTTHDLAITDPTTRTALHGLVADAAWTVTTRLADTVALEHRLVARPGYPWALLLQVTYALTASGLTVSHFAHNLAASEAPYAIGAHPYVVADAGPVDDWVVELDASRVLLVDAERMLPLNVVGVDQVGLDFRQPRAVGASRINHAFTDLGRDARGRAVVSVSGDSGRVVVWAGEGCRWIQLYTGDFDVVSPRRSLAVEPMSAPADALNSGQDLVVLAPEGHVGSTYAMQWGIDLDRQG